MALTGKKLKFCHHYGHHENGALAARQAGYSPKGARKMAHKLLQQPEVKTKCEELIAERMARLEITGERILNELSKIAFADISDIVDLDNNSITVEDFKALSPEQRACIASAKKDKHGNVVLTFHDKIAALTKLGQNKKLFTDVQENKNTFTAMGSVTVEDSEGNTKPLEFDIGQEPDTPVTEH